MNEKNSKTLVFADVDNGGVIHVANIKGGVGKSTVATNLAAALAKRGPTLIIDLDVQGSATHALGKDPLEFNLSSWDLFHSRFSINDFTKHSNIKVKDKLFHYIHKSESVLLPQIVGNKDITSLIVKIKPCLDLIPATSNLFNNTHFYHYQNFIYNIQLYRTYYKYIILDTPSVWNRLTRLLYTHSDLNLIPVTLNALSTKSLYEYLKNIKKLTQKNPKVRIRIVKNEVFGKKGSKVKGKIRTMVENRFFLESLCEQAVFKNDKGISLLPQSILFDLEIPESSTVHNAQDIGKTIHEYSQYSSVAKAFDELSKHVQYVLNNPIETKFVNPFKNFKSYFPIAVKAIAALIILSIFTMNKPISSFTLPRPVVPQQLVKYEKKVFEHQFNKKKSIMKMVKYAICHFNAVVPSRKQISSYAKEVIRIHNITRMPHENKIPNSLYVPKGTIVRFYPPSKIDGNKTEKLIPVYKYFAAIVDDPYAYITGDWCERGTGGGTPHYGIDVAANLGTEIKSPIDGIAILNSSRSAGRKVGIIRNGMVIFFAHMAKRYVKSGDRINKGDAIGTVGMTGFTSGPHVHIGYGLKSSSNKGIMFGSNRYKLTDPKLFFYREHYFSKLDKISSTE